MKILQAIINGIVNLFLSPIAFGAFYTLALVGLIFWFVFSIISNLFKIVVLDLPAYLFFGIQPGQGINSISLPRTYYQFLIISFVLWLIQFFLFIYRFSKELDSQKSSMIFKMAIKASFKGVLTLILFHVLILFFNLLVYQFTNMILSNGKESYNYFDLSNKIILSFFPNDWNVPIPFDTSNGHLSWIKWPLGFLGWGGPKAWVSDSLLGRANITGASICITGLLICIPLIKCLIDVVGRLFLSWILFLFFPFVPAFSINDGGKRVKIWKDKFISNYLVGPAYLIGLSFLGIFIGKIVNFVFANISKGSFFDTLSGNTILWISALFSVFLILGAIFGFKKITELIMAFIGAELDPFNGVETAKAAKGQYDKFRSGKAAKEGNKALAENIGKQIAKNSNPAVKAGTSIISKA